MRLSCLFECGKFTVAEIGDMIVTPAFGCCRIEYMLSQVMFHIYLKLIFFLGNIDNVPIILVEDVSS